MHLAGSRDLEPAALERTGVEHHVDLGGRLREREERRAEAHLQLIGLEETVQEVGVHPLQIREADVLTDPEALDLMEHRRVRGVGVDPVRATRGNHLDGRLVHPGIPDLHRARVGPQEQSAFDVESVVHRARRVVLRLVQRREVVPVGLDLGAVGHVETDGGKDLLDALPRPGNRMDAAPRPRAAGQRDVDGFLAKPRLEHALREGVSPGRQRGLDAFLRGIDAGPDLPALLGIELAERLQDFGEPA